MESHTFDALSKSLSGTPSRRAAGRALIGLALGGTLGPLFGLGGAGARRRGKSKSKSKNKNKRKKCRNCGADTYCERGKCEACKPLETACTADVQCCSGICDSYRDECAEVRFACNPNKPGQCANNGICCDFGDDGFFFCADDPTTNQKACGTSCADYVNCFNQGNDAQCQNGKCCCAGPNCATSLPPC
jgi:hypothetical protein